MRIGSLQPAVDSAPDHALRPYNTGVTRPADIPGVLRTAPFTTAMAREHGVSAQTLRGSRFRHPYRGVLVWHLLPRDLATQVDAARLILPATAMASHLTSVELLGGQVPWTPRPHFWVPASHAGRSVRGLHLHAYDRRPAGVEVDGRMLTAPGKTFVDCATQLNLVQLVAVGDSLVRRGWIMPEHLRLVALEAARRDIRKARLAAHFVRERVDSWQESRTRMLIVLGDLPEPETGLPMHDESGGWLATPDLSYRGVKIAIEYDGGHHDEDLVQRDRDVMRDENLRDDGWIVIVVRAADLRLRPAVTLMRILRALQQRGHPSVPCWPSDGWRPYFPATPFSSPSR